MHEISEKMHDADGLLVGSLVYFASPNGTLLSLLDRLFYSNLHTNWSMKVGASVSIARRGGATTTMDALNMMVDDKGVRINFSSRSGMK